MGIRETSEMLKQKYLIPDTGPKTRAKQFANVAMAATGAGVETGDDWKKLTVEQYQRRQRAECGWWNWYANRGRLSLNPTASELRRVSWRRAI